MENLINTKEAAAILNVSPKTLEKWRERKLFGVPFFTADEKHGDTWYYYRERVEQLKSVYQKGVLQNMYKLADEFDALPVPDFQKSPTSGNTPFASGFYSAETVAKILGLSEITLSRWREKKFFVEDYRTHVGISLYSQDHVLEMKLYCQKKEASYSNPTRLEEVTQPRESPSTVLKRRNIQIRPSTVRVELNDKQTRTIFYLSEESANDLLNGSTFELVEKHNHKRVGDVITTYKILNAAGYDVRRPLNQFDRAVLSVCISEWLAGNRCTTIPIIHRALTGRVNKGSNAKPTKAQRAAILDSVDLLMHRIFISDPSNARRLLGYDDGRTTEINSALLPGWYAEGTTAINGQDTDLVIFFDNPCPLLAMAQAKRQILTYDTKLLDVPGQQNTLMNIVLKNYSMIRVQEILAHNQMRPIVTFSDVLERCHLGKAHSEVKRRAHEFMIAFFEQLKNESAIKDFEFI